MTHLLDADVFPIGRSLLRAMSQGTLVVGFAIGSVIVAAVGPRWLLAADVASFLGSATLIRFGTRYTPAPQPDGDHSVRALVHASGEGLRYTFRTPPLRRLVVFSWAVPAFGAVADGLAVAYTVEAGSVATAAGALFTGYAAGTVVGELVVSRLSPGLRRRLVVPLAMASQLPAIVFVLVPSIPLAAALLFVAGSGFAFDQGVDPLIVAVCDPNYRGRLFTVQGSGLMTVQGAGIVARRSRRNGHLSAPSDRDSGNARDGNGRGARPTGAALTTALVLNQSHLCPARPIGRARQGRFDGATEISEP